MAQVIGGVFSRHDRERFTVTAYSYGADDGSVYRRRIATDCDRFVDLHHVADDDLRAASATTASTSSST